ncbi:MAG: hypothetical protein AAF639_39895 [Chloroflexota bacterium]
MDTNQHNNTANRLLVIIALAYVLIVIVRHAWLSDDAYITLRTVDHWTNGYGPVYNVGERVQSYTHPLWMFVIAIPYAVTQEPYFTVLGTSMLVTMSALAIVVFCIAEEKFTGVCLLLALSLSKAFIDYSTSGLENPLTYLLLACYGWVLLKTELNNRHHFILALLCALGMLNRLDTTLLFLPPLLYSLWRQLNWPHINWLRLILTAVGLLPIILWELFSLIYYGFLLPNTAYAKLNTGIPQSELWLQGITYYLDSLIRDPITLALIVIAFAVMLFQPQGMDNYGRRLAGMVGIALYLVYIARIGGDFMSGRFLAAPCFFALILLPNLVKQGWQVIPLLAIIFVLGLSSPAPTWSSPAVKMSRDEIISERGISDERAYYRDSWLLDLHRLGPALSLDVKHGKHRRQALEARNSHRKIFIVGSAGQRGYFAGPDLYVFDDLVLSDPLRARIPAIRDINWRVGHYTRVTPEGYLETIETGENQLKDKRLAQYYEHLSLIIHDELWSIDRWKAIMRMNLGHYDHLIDFVRYRYPSTQILPIQDMSYRPVQGDPWLHPDMLVSSDSGIIVTIDDTFKNSQILEISVASHNQYRLVYRKQQSVVATQVILPTYFPPAAFMNHRLVIPETAQAVGFDQIHLLPEWSPESLDGFIDEEIEEIERADLFTVGQMKLY